MTAAFRSRIFDAWLVLRGDAIVENRRIVAFLHEKLPDGRVRISKVLDISVCELEVVAKYGAPTALPAPMPGAEWRICVLRAPKVTT